MSTQLAGERVRERTRRAYREASVSLLGPLAVAGGIAWALAQPYRITLLSPRGEGFWWLLVQPPLLVIAVGVAFHLLIAPALVRDLRAAEEEDDAP